jgi:hypothetical protein
MIRTGIHYLARDDLYKVEKPFSADFEVDGMIGAKKSNLIMDVREVDITPIIGPNQFNIDTHGFCIINQETSLTLEDALEKPGEVEPIYQHELEAVLHKHLPKYKRFESLDFVVHGSSLLQNHVAYLSSRFGNVMHGTLPTSEE